MLPVMLLLPTLQLGDLQRVGDAGDGGGEDVLHLHYTDVKARGQQSFQHEGLMM